LHGGLLHHLALHGLLHHLATLLHDYTALHRHGLHGHGLHGHGLHSLHWHWPSHNLSFALGAAANWANTAGEACSQDATNN
jgi:hypothetical protein